MVIDTDVLGCGRQPARRHVEAHVVETAIGALGGAFAGEHARRVFFGALEGIDPGRVRELAGDVLGQVPAQHVAPRAIVR
jgi:hypothetical protein